MKIARSSPVQPVEPTTPRNERSPPGATPPQDTVTLSSSAAFVERARQAAADGPPLRPDVVSDVKQALEAGTFEQSVDFQSVLDGLLADL